MKEEWKDVLNFEGLYRVSNLGRIKSLSREVNCRYGTRWTREKFLGTGTKGDYVKLLLSANGTTKSISAHKLVAEHFIHNPNGLFIINHLNGIKHDNRVENLEWCTQSENVIHASRVGLYNAAKGEKCGSSKLTEEDVLLIYKLTQRGFLNHQIATLFCVAHSTVNNIKLNKSWKHIDRDRKI